MTKLHTYDLVLIALFTALLGICAWVSIPGPVPFTLQTFGVFATVSLLGGKRSTVCILSYLLLGLIGIPVFSGFSGGFGHLLGATGGYTLGFLAVALFIWMTEHLPGCANASLFLKMVLGLVLCYAIGTCWFMIVYSKNAGPITLWSALSMCVLPYVLPDLAKIALAISITNRIRKTGLLQRVL